MSLVSLPFMFQFKVFSKSYYFALANFVWGAGGAAVLLLIFSTFLCFS